MVITIMRRHNFTYFLREGFRGIFLHGLMSFAAVGIIVACLLIMGTFALVAVNVEAMLGDLEQENSIIAFVDENLSEEQARAIGDKLESISNVQSSTFISREQALKEFVAKYKDDSLFSEIPASALRNRYQIYIKDIEKMADTVQQIKATNGIVDVRAQLEIAKGFVTVRNIAGAVSIILIAVLLAVSLFIISNTIRLAAFTRREEIAIMKMCGATNSFVRWPFLYEGLILGLLGAVIAFALQWVIYTLITNAVEASDVLSLISMIPFSDLQKEVALVFLAIGFAVGVGGSGMAIGRFLRV